MRHEIAYALIALMAFGLALLIWSRSRRNKRHKARDRSLRVDLLRHDEN